MLLCPPGSSQTRSFYAASSFLSNSKNFCVFKRFSDVIKCKWNRIGWWINMGQVGCYLTFHNHSSLFLDIFCYISCFWSILLLCILILFPAPLKVVWPFMAHFIDNFWHFWQFLSFLFLFLPNLFSSLYVFMRKMIWCNGLWAPRKRRRGVFFSLHSLFSTLSMSNVV